MTPRPEHSATDQPDRDDERDAPGGTPADEPVGDFRGGEQSDPGGDSDADVSSDG